MWYPSKERQRQIEAELEGLGKGTGRFEGWQDDLLRQATSSLRELSAAGALPEPHLLSWIWIGSQLRLHSPDRTAVPEIAGRALRYLVQHAKEGKVECAADLRWVRHRAASQLRRVLGGAPQSLISVKEEKLAEDYWFELAECDQPMSEDEWNQLSAYSQIFTSKGSSRYLPCVARMIQRLSQESSTIGMAGELSRGALRYLIREHDVVDDGLGYFGLVDDVHVIRRAHADVTGECSWAAAMPSFLEKWPQLSDIEFDDGEVTRGLSPHLCLAIGAILDCIERPSSRNALVFSELGPIPLLAAFMAAVALVNDAAARSQELLSFLKPGEDVSLTAEGQHLRFRWRGCELVEDEHLYKVEANKGALFLRLEEARCLKRAIKPHKTLSPAGKVSAWRETWQPNPLRTFWGGLVDFDLLEHRVLLVASRNDIEPSLKEVRPLGRSIPELVGVRYVTRRGTSRNLGRNELREPLIWCVADGIEARNLLRKEAQRFRAVILCDSCEKRHSVLREVLRADVNPVVLTTDSRHEFIRHLTEHDFSTWHIRRRDVSPSRPVDVREIKEEGALGRFMARRALDDVSNVQTEICRDQSLEKLYKSFDEARDSLQDQPVLKYRILSLIKRLRLAVTPISENEADRLSSLATELLTATQALEHPDARGLEQSLHKALASIEPGTLSPKGVALLETVGPLATQSRVFVLAHPRNVKDLRGLLDRLLPESSIAVGAMKDLRTCAPVERLVVVGWLDREHMRLLEGAGMALNQQWLLYPFESQWAERSLRARRARLTRVCKESRARLLDYLPGALGGLLETPVAVVEETLPDSAYSGLAQEATRLIRATTANQEHHERALADAVLVLLSAGDRYVFFAKNSKVVDLRTLCDDYGLERNQRTNESSIMTRVTRLEPGALLAFPGEGRGDVLDAIVERLEPQTQELRQTAGIWRVAIRLLLERFNRDAGELATWLATRGLSRGAATILRWANSSETLAPKNYRKDLAILAEISGHEELRVRLGESCSAIERLYKLRRRAASELVDRLCGSTLDVDDDVLELDVAGHVCAYNLFRVDHIARETVAVPYSELGSPRKVDVTARVRRKAEVTT